jgi:dTDP-4-amino-4,6-dideoxygalactose transaminase
MMRIPFLDLELLHRPIQNQLDAAYHRVMNSGLFIMGPELEGFEEEFSRYCEVKYCVGVGNGLEALHLLLRAYGIGAGDEVIVPSNTFVATWLAVSQCGAVPVPVEPHRDTHNLDPTRIAQAITSRTRAIIPVHLYGQPADMDPICAIAAEHGLVVIEDAAQAQGARYKGRRVGSLGHAAATSFYPGKNLGAFGDGGAVLTDDEAIANKVRQLRSYGSTVKYQHDIAGYNSRLDEMQAAFLRVKLQRLDDWNARRRTIASLYSELLASSDISLPYVPDYAEPVWHLYVITSEQRNALRESLDRNGISTVIHYPIPPHKQKCYSEFAARSFPIAEALAEQVLSLPISSAMNSDAVVEVGRKVLAFLAAMGATIGPR